MEDLGVIEEYNKLLCGTPVAEANKGFPNAGTNCFITASVSLLFCCKNFMAELSDAAQQYLTKERTDEDSKKARLVVKHLTQLYNIKEAPCDEHKKAVFSKLVADLRDINPSYREKTQHDAAEVLALLLSCIDRWETTVNTQQSIPNELENFIPIYILKKYFEYGTRIETTCNWCHQVASSEDFKVADMLMLQVPADNLSLSINISALFAQKFESEVGGACDSCHSSDTIKKLVIDGCPNLCAYRESCRYLFVGVGRVKEMENENSLKIRTPVQFHTSICLHCETTGDVPDVVRTHSVIMPDSDEQDKMMVRFVDYEWQKHVCSKLGLPTPIDLKKNGKPGKFRGDAVPSLSCSGGDTAMSLSRAVSMGVCGTPDNYQHFQRHMDSRRVDGRHENPEHGNIAVLAQILQTPIWFSQTSGQPSADDLVWKKFVPGTGTSHGPGDIYIMKTGPSYEWVLRFADTGKVAREEPTPVPLSSATAECRLNHPAKLYDLVGMVMHSGDNPTTSHYICYRQSYDTADKWEKANDNVVTTFLMGNCFSKELQKRVVFALYENTGSSLV